MNERNPNADTTREKPGQATGRPVGPGEDDRVVESPEGAAPSPAPEDTPPDDVRRQAGTSGEQDGMPLTPDGNV